MSYDDWKLQTPPEEYENECLFCGEPCSGSYCNDDHKRADISENC